MAQIHYKLNCTAIIILRLAATAVNERNESNCCPTYKQFVLQLAWLEQLKQVYQTKEEDE